MESPQNLSDEQNNPVEFEDAQPATAKALTLDKLTQTDLENIISRVVSTKFDQLAKAGGLGKINTGASHVNSGPTQHSNVPGHANFTKVGHPGDIFAGGAHANSGPTNHANGGGHANFTKVNPGSARVFPSIAVTLPDGLHINIPAGQEQVVTVNGFRITRG